eukprot:m51a1_g3246 hypothetical protein (401) ;mRNA; f:138901-140597
MLRPSNGHTTPSPGDNPVAPVLPYSSADTPLPGSTAPAVRSPAPKTPGQPQPPVRRTTIPREVIFSKDPQALQRWIAERSAQVHPEKWAAKSAGPCDPRGPWKGRVAGVRACATFAAVLSYSVYAMVAGLMLGLPAAAGLFVGAFAFQCNSVPEVFALLVQPILILRYWHGAPGIRTAHMWILVSLSLLVWPTVSVLGSIYDQYYSLNHSAFALSAAALFNSAGRDPPEPLLVMPCLALTYLFSASMLVCVDTAGGIVSGGFMTSCAYISSNVVQWNWKDVVIFATQRKAEAVDMQHMRDVTVFIFPYLFLLAAVSFFVQRQRSAALQVSLFMLLNVAINVIAVLTCATVAHSVGSPLTAKVPSKDVIRRLYPPFVFVVTLVGLVCGKCLRQISIQTTWL